MPLRCVVPALVAVVLLCAAPAAVAHPKEHRYGGVKVAPIERIGDLSAEEVLTRFMTQPYQEPLPETWGCLPFLPGTVQLLVSPEGGAHSCTIPKGTKLVLIVAWACSTAEPPPFFGQTEAERRACVEQHLATGPTETLSIDGGPAIELTSDPFALPIVDFDVEVLPGNAFEAQPGPASVTAGGHGLTVKLSRGRHTLTLTATGEQAPPPATVTVDVVDPNKPPC